MRWQRGVVFIKEIVPKAALTFVANSVYNENYETMNMEHHWNENAGKRTVVYKWKKENEWQSFKVVAAHSAVQIETGSETEFITEHYWGYAAVNKHKTNEYEVTHPKWEKYEVLNYELKVDFDKVYGNAFSFLSQQKPDSVMLAEGSKITVESKSVIKN